MALALAALSLVVPRDDGTAPSSQLPTTTGSTVGSESTASPEAAAGEVPSAWVAFALPRDDRVPALVPGQQVILFASASGATDRDRGAWWDTATPGTIPSARRVVERAVVVATARDSVTVAVPADQAGELAGALASGPVVPALVGPATTSTDGDTASSASDLARPDRP